MRPNVVETGLLSVGSVVPAVGVLLLGWGATAVATVYVAEILTLACSYVAVALFGQRPSAVDERDRTEIPLLPIPDLGVLPEQIDLPGLPPIRAENVHIAGVSALFHLVIALSVGAILTDNVGESTSVDRRAPIDLSGFFGDVFAQLDPVVGTLVAVTALSQLAVVYRWYVAPSRYQTLSAYVTVQRLGRIVVGVLAVGILWVVVGGVLSLFVAPSVPVDAVTLSVTGFCLLKLRLEQRRIAGESEPAPEGRGAWLVPVDQS